MRHDGPKLLFAGLAKEAFRDVEVEPKLQPLTGESFELKTTNIQDDARSDVRIRSFWRKVRNAFFDFKVSYPFASTYRNQSIESMYKTMEKTKKREYQRRIFEIEDGDFTPMIMTSTGGMGREMSIAIGHLARTLADKKNNNYSDVIRLIRCQFNFAIIRSSLICLRGSRSISKHSMQQCPHLNVESAMFDIGLV